jgi:RNA polymerase sigma-70 factor, ECF subfamily
MTAPGPANPPPPVGAYEWQMDLAALSDQALIAQLQTQDSGALDELYGRYSRAIYSLSFRILGDGSAAEDVLQEVFLKLWRQPQSYDATRGTLSAWLLSVAHHRAIDFLRRQRTRAEHQFPEGWEEAPWENNDGNDPADLASHSEDVTAIKRALTQIPASQRIAIEMAFFQGKTHAEISAELGEPLGTAKTRIRLGMRKLRTLLEADGVLKVIP